jgi:ABC-type dipeptide/oligopeptide/nickel transport system permease subunit
MEYFGSAILKAVVSSVLFVLADSPKIIGPSLSFCMTTSVVSILMMSFLSFFQLLQAYAPLPDWSAFEVE